MQHNDISVSDSLKHPLQLDINTECVGCIPLSNIFVSIRVDHSLPIHMPMIYMPFFLIHQLMKIDSSINEKRGRKKFETEPTYP